MATSPKAQELAKIELLRSGAIAVLLPFLKNPAGKDVTCGRLVYVPGVRLLRGILS